MEERIAPVGTELRRARQQGDLTQTELAERLGLVHPSTISRWETGRQQVPDTYVDAISQVLGTREGWATSLPQRKLLELRARSGAFDAIDYLHGLRLQVGLLQQDVAKRAGYRDGSSLSRWERHIEEPGPSEITRLAQAIGASEEQLDTAMMLAGYPPAQLSRVERAVVSALADVRAAIGQGDHRSALSIADALASAPATRRSGIKVSRLSSDLFLAGQESASALGADAAGLRLLRAAVAAARDADDPFQLGYALSALSHGHYLADDYRRAIAVASSGLDALEGVARRRGDRIELRLADLELDRLVSLTYLQAADGSLAVAPPDALNRHANTMASQDARFEPDAWHARAEVHGLHGRWDEVAKAWVEETEAAARIGEPDDVLVAIVDGLDYATVVGDRQLAAELTAALEANSADDEFGLYLEQATRFLARLDEG